MYLRFTVSKQTGFNVPCIVRKEMVYSSVLQHFSNAAFDLYYVCLESKIRQFCNLCLTLLPLICCI